ncbi:glycosyltransferase family 39 protein [Candidatus Woesebacteria bacterium]|nr:glycosyltransferase family 39 protein [Candidatus Woesebacteria bacterium]
MKKALSYFLLASFLLVGFALRLYKISSPVADWHSWRQADTASVSKIYVEEGIEPLNPRYLDISTIQTGYYNPKGLRLVEFPLYNIIHALLFKAYPGLSLEVWGRLTSTFSVLISSVFIFALGNRFIGKNGGLIASAVFLFLPYNIYFSRVILPEPLAVTLALAGLWAFVKFFDSESWLYFFSSAILISLSILVKPFTLFYLIPVIYLSLKKYDLKRIFSTPKLFINFLVFANIITVPLLAWRVWINMNPVGIPHFTWAFNGDKIRFRPAFFRWIFGERIGRLILGTWGLIPFSMGVLVSNKKNIFNLVFLLSVIAFAFTIATASVRHDYYQIFLIPPISLIFAQGALALWKGFPGVDKTLARGLLIFASFIALIVSANEVKAFYAVNHPEIVEAGKLANEILPKDALVLAPYNGDTAFLYQTGRRGWPVIEDSIDNLIKKGADYYISVDVGSPDSKNFRERFEVVRETSSFVILDLHKEK